MFSGYQQIANKLLNQGNIGQGVKRDGQKPILPYDITKTESKG
jgi:hypothetical protein